MNTSGILGYPRIGKKRELKFALEKFWKQKISQNDLQQTAELIQKENWHIQQKLGLDHIPSNDFSFYDQVLDTSFMLGAIPERFQENKKLSGLDLYFAMARGYQDEKGNSIPAMEMTKWFNTNYHYIVPEIGPDTKFQLNSKKPVEAFKFAKSLGIQTRPVIIGPVSFLLLSKSQNDSFSPLMKLAEILPLYSSLFEELKRAGAEWVQLDEPYLAIDLKQEAIDAYTQIFNHFRTSRPDIKIMLTAYFGDLSVNTELAKSSPFEGLHLDLTNIQDPEKILSALSDEMVISMGLINGRNIWKNDLQQSLDRIKHIDESYNFTELIIAPSCSMLHVPYDLSMESELDGEIASWLAFAEQKLNELAELKKAANQDYQPTSAFQESQAVVDNRKAYKKKSKTADEEINTSRQNEFNIRQKKQLRKIALPKLPTTTIGSFPQTKAIRKLRSDLRKGNISAADYKESLKAELEKTIRFQEEIGLDVLVHGEFERNDMVQYFAEQMLGFIFTQNGWVQSFGSRCVRPPVIFGNVSRPEPMTVEWSSYAQSLTKKPVKGMLTGPVTILKWSFVRDDQPLSETCRQIALAIRQEVLDLEEAGIGIIQIDEPALREGLPIHRRDWQEYLQWAVECFRVSSSGVRDETQIHTHMCYAEFNDIIESIARMDADVISIEASRSRMDLLDAFNNFNYPNEIGPGVYDIHSPNVPATEEMVDLIHKALKVIPARQLWINPDCGLKTRQWEEITPSLENMISAVELIREELQ